jgi:hypothetical protein
MLSRKQLEVSLRKWNQAWSKYDLDGVMEIFHDEILFDNWTGGMAKGSVFPPSRQETEIFFRPLFPSGPLWTIAHIYTSDLPVHRIFLTLESSSHLIS